MCCVRYQVSLYAENKIIEIVNLIYSNNINYISMTAHVHSVVAYLLTSLRCTGLASNYKFKIIDDKFSEHSTKLQHIFKHHFH